MNLFVSLLKLYRSRGLKTPIEDFTTEILANILQGDSMIMSCFTKKILRISGENYKVATQETFALSGAGRTYCRIDMIFRNDDSICFLENKVHSGEGYGQLSSYAEVLDSLSLYHHKFLRFCTKFYQDKSHILQHGFLQFRWGNIAGFLSQWRDREIINAFIEFLEINNMGSSTDFTMQEILALENFNPALRKMESYLEKIKPKFMGMFGGSKAAASLNQLRDHNRHVIWREYIFGIHYSDFGAGFNFDDAPHTIVWMWTDARNPDIDIYKKMLGDIPDCDTDGVTYFGFRKPLSDFLSSEDMEFAIEQWFIQTFKKVRMIMSDHPELNWNLPAEDFENH